MKNYFNKFIYIYLFFTVLFIPSKVPSETIKPYDYGIDMDQLSDDLLELPDGIPEIYVTLKGTLKLNVLFEEEENSICYWVLQLDVPSFQIACTTPVWGYALSLKEIMKTTNWHEVQLGLEENMEDFCKKNVNCEVLVGGFLFHAHTAHHHAPFVLDLKEIYSLGEVFQ
jgi:hypothetical protein